MKGGLVDAIVAAWQKGHPMYYALSGTVTKASASPKRCDVKVGDATVPDIEYTAEGVPAIDAECLVVFRGNNPDQGLAVGFSRFASIEMEVGSAPAGSPTNATIKTSAEKIELKLLQTEIKLEPTALTAKVGTNELLGAAASGWVFKGPVEFQADVHMKEELTVDKKATVNGIDFENHGHPYTDEPGSIAKVTSKAQPLGA
ncbi:hypothetical protein [Leptonema illini]|uniref:Uncharacterized protein n=1 Tax=Leptonema illini DSM 21528 TaxID=929563 RepID=H2CL69_9LEPT|nr:hypothetical protein [Leptonema illini]EHQ08320.1 hypothetical protein Lepil_3663 [Leptonema illini DSM 21528]